MAIVCDQCKENAVLHNGDICDECKNANEEAKIDRSYVEKVYLRPELYERFETLHNAVLAEKKNSKSAFGKFMDNLKTSFINPKTGKEINNPTPQVIIPAEKTLDRIQKILNHNLAVYAAQNDLDTPEDLDDWSVADMMADDWETSLFQHVENVKHLMDDDLEPTLSTKDEDVEKPAEDEGGE